MVERWCRDVLSGMFSHKLARHYVGVSCNSGGWGCGRLCGVVRVSGVGGWGVRVGVSGQVMAVEKKPNYANFK